MVSRTRKNGYTEWRCLPCNATRAKMWRENDPIESRRRAKQYHYTHKWGLSTAEIAKFFKKHKNRCGICGKREHLQIDHDHKTGQLRGLLCRGCNLRLGWFEKHRNSIGEYLCSN